MVARTIFLKLFIFLLGGHYPSCWTKDQWMKFRSDHTWLFANDGKLGCSICRSAQSLGPNRSTTGMRVQLSKEWTNGNIQPYGNVRDKQVTSLRKKIYDHRDSSSHKVAVELKQESGNEKLKTVISDTQKKTHRQHL